MNYYRITNNDQLGLIAQLRLYDGQVQSTWSCSVIAGVFDEMLETMFNDLPGSSGKPETIELSFLGDC